MNSSGIAERSRHAFRSTRRVPYTCLVMNVQKATDRVSGSTEGECSLGLPCAAMSEVQIPKLSSWEVASTP
jgi:hypothetical protein